MLFFSSFKISSKEYFVKKILLNKNLKKNLILNKIIKKKGFLNHKLVSTIKADLLRAKRTENYTEIQHNAGIYILSET